jgi:DNA (cytosine-5)-methyltransferase 1
MRVIRNVPEGGIKKDIPEEFRPKSGFPNSYGRLWWDRPSMTITRNLGTPSSARCIHPKCDRALTTREGARLQSFPDDYVFYGSRSKMNLQIGNAVPPLLAMAIANQIKKALS